MEMSTFWFFTFFQFYIGINVCVANCPNGWTTFMSSCYFFTHQDETFKDAERTCSHFSSHLVAIESAAEKDFIVSMLIQLKSDRHWIGLTDELIEGVWTWYHNDQPATYTDWNPGHPHHANMIYNCADIYSVAPYSYRWVDDRCDSKFRAICEKSGADNAEMVGK